MKKLLTLAALAAALGGCATMNCSNQQGERNAIKTDADARQTIAPNTSANLPIN